MGFFEYGEIQDQLYDTFSNQLNRRVNNKLYSKLYCKLDDICAEAESVVMDFIQYPNYDDLNDDTGWL